MLEREAAWLRVGVARRLEYIAQVDPRAARCMLSAILAAVAVDPVRTELTLRRKDRDDAARAVALEDQARALREEAGRPCRW
jgi:hypothetical protein